MNKIANLTNAIRDNINSQLFGCDSAIELVLCALIAEGHVMVEDVPGLGKTSLAKALAASIGGSFKRIQFTPDLLPSDITGIHLFDNKTNSFILHKGPVFTNILLADEINRANPRVQSALLQCMQERQVTLDGDTLSIESPYFVIATMNPIELQGTFPLPEAQIDRFMMNISMGYPDTKSEIRNIEKGVSEKNSGKIKVVATLDEVAEAQEAASKIYLSEPVKKYIVDLVNATRENEKIRLGVSPRGTIALAKAAQAWAGMKGRDYVIPDDIKDLARPVLSHRIITDSLNYIRTKESSGDLIDYLLTKVPVPLE